MKERAVCLKLAALTDRCLQLWRTATPPHFNSELKDSQKNSGWERRWKTEGGGLDDFLLESGSRGNSSWETQAKQPMQQLSKLSRECTLLCICTLTKSMWSDSRRKKERRKNSLLRESNSTCRRRPVRKHLWKEKDTVKYRRENREKNKQGARSKT